MTHHNIFSILILKDATNIFNSNRTVALSNMDQSPLKESSEDMNPDKPPEQGDEASEPNVPDEDSEEAMQIR